MSHKPAIQELISKIISLRNQGVNVTLLAICPNSDAVLEAAVKVAANNEMPMLFAATLNQVDRGGGYTSWTPHTFVARMEELAREYNCSSPLYPCLDHGGPWLKDLHTLEGLNYAETMHEVKETLTACLESGYDLLHIDPTVDRELPDGHSLGISTVVARTVELIVHAEQQRQRLGRSNISYEVGTEEVHGGLVDTDNFTSFLEGLQKGLEKEGLLEVWPSFIVAKVGTDLHTTFFDSKTALNLYNQVAPLGSLIKGHYTDWVANPSDYPASGMGGANIGPEFTATELVALDELCDQEEELYNNGSNLSPSNFRQTLRKSVVDSNRWNKWLFPQEEGKSFDELIPERQDWLVSTGARYIWTDPNVLNARQNLYTNLSSVLSDVNGYVVNRVAENIQNYVEAFNLKGSIELFLET